MGKNPSFSFSNALLKWFDEHGRKNLPWQHPIAPYRVWLSEVMLQQTQVETVIPYFERFLKKFPSVKALAKAPLDDVLHLWTGLGYYARARNLHKCAQLVVSEYKGKFPSDVEQLVELPGIGKSTACAISSIAFGQATAILDGNVKRVLTRFHAVEGWPGKPKVEKMLWQYADSHMPQERCADYTQAIMDLGATLCTRSSPNCPACPMQDNCEAYLGDEDVTKYPEKKPRKATPEKSTTMLIVRDQKDRILLEQRPTQGIWGGLWSFMEFDSTENALTYCQQLGKVGEHESWSEITHVFSHYKLKITPLLVTLNSALSVQEDGKQWVTLEESLNLGLAAPVKRLIQNVQKLSEFLI